jgi:hypothetical protein
MTLRAGRLIRLDVVTVSPEQASVAPVDEE